MLTIISFYLNSAFSISENSMKRDLKYRDFVRFQFSFLNISRVFIVCESKLCYIER